MSQGGPKDPASEDSDTGDLLHDIGVEITGATKDDAEGETEDVLSLRAYLRPRLKEAFGFSFLFFCVLVLFSGWLVYHLKGVDAIFVSLDGASDLAITIAPRLTAALLIAGFIRALVSQQFVAEWLGSKSRLRGIIIGELAGMLTPGGPMTAFSLIAALKVAGADRGVLISYSVSWSLLGFQRVLLWDLPLLGSDFTITRLLASLPLPILAGLMARYVPIDIYADVRKGPR